MPRQHQPPSLRKASVKSIVRHFEDFWCAWNTRDLIWQSSQSEFTPFQNLCDNMIQEIIDTLNKGKLFRPDHFKLLLHSNIRHLNLGLRVIRWFRNSVQTDVLKRLSNRCQKLTHLNLGCLYEANDIFLCKLVRNLPQIVCLKDITGDASVIKAISENCPNLLELHLNCKMSVKNTDLLYLCNYPENPKTRPKLKNLSINGAYNILDTVVQLLNNQTSLQCLLTGRNHLIDHAFDKMYGEEFRSIKKVPSELIHNLLDITIKVVSYGSLKLDEADRLDLTFQCCPFLSRLTLYDLRKGESLNNVAKLKHLKTFSVSMFRKCNFAMYMTPLLSEIGDNLTGLFCSEFDEISLTLIGKLCPNLESLELSVVSMISEQHPIDGDVTQSSPYFSNLKGIRISLSSDDHPSLTENILSLLLQNATKIVHCKFRNVTNLTDSVISKANRKHGFRHLSTCCFISCSPISVESLWVLLCTDNPLELLNVYGCKYVTQQDIDLLQNEAKLRQFNIDIN